MDKASKKDLVSRLFSNLEEYYVSNGFTYIKTGANRFEKNELIVYIGPSAEYIDSLVFRPFFRVHNLAIGKILKKLFPEQIGIEITIVRYQSPTLITEMKITDFTSDYIHVSAHGSSIFYSIGKKTNLDPIVADHINFMNKVGLPFFAKVDSLQGINDFLNNRILKGDLAFFQSEARIMELKLDFSQREVLSGVTSAYLINSTHIEELLDRYRLFFAGNNYVLEPMEKVVDYFSNKAVMTIEEIHAERDAKHKALIEKAKQNKEIIQNQVEVNKIIEEAEGKEIKEIESTSDAVSLYLKGGNEEKVIEWIRRDKREIIEFCLLLEETYRDDGIELDSNESEIMFNKIYNLVNNT